MGVLPVAVQGEHPLDDALDAVRLVGHPAEVAQLLLAGGNVAGQVGGLAMTSGTTRAWGSSPGNRLFQHANGLPVQRSLR